MEENCQSFVFVFRAEMRAIYLVIWSLSVCDFILFFVSLIKSVSWGLFEVQGSFSVLYWQSVSIDFEDFMKFLENKKNSIFLEKLKKIEEK